MQNCSLANNNYSCTRVPLWTLLLVLLVLSCLPRARASVVPQQYSMPKQALEWVVSFEVRSLEDLERLQRRCRIIIESLPAGPEAQDARDTVMTVEDFASPQTAPGEELLLVSFTHSDDPAIRRLRDSVGLKPPEGAAVVRVYPTPAEMPSGIRRLFRGETAGITFLTRYIAIWTEGRSDEETADLLSHELAHAFVLSLLGLEANRLPQWFHEGLALHLSGGKTQYISHQDYGHTRVSWSPRDYNEWRRAFRYLDRRFGTEETERFIREAIETRDAEGALRKVIGLSGYPELARLARRRWLLEQTTRAGAILGLLALAAYLLRLRAWRERREMLEDDEMRW
ncbi:MAG: hypothetical protein KatS3mg024_1622 [Armatimonadota bacterium]|nr:MAG: hypothetical protein KatS3mg024_1622 [Armatimonadota bacterium]